MSRRLSSFLVIAGCITGGLWTCSYPIEPLAQSYPYSYYPLDTGRYLEYAVDSIIYNETTANDTVFWYVKEMITDTFYDLEGHQNYLIERYRRKTLLDEWELTNIWSAKYINGQVQKTENNLRFIKLVSPPTNGVNWDGNAYLGGLDDLPADYECNRLSFYEGWEYQYADVGESYPLPYFNFTNTLTVEQQGDSNLIWFDYAREVYAEDVGMIEKTFKHYYTQDITCPDCPWEERVQCGYSVYMRLIGYH